jgi:hypothetical protein
MATPVGKQLFSDTQLKNSDLSQMAAGDTTASSTPITQVGALVEGIERKDYWMSARPVKLCDGCDLRPYCDANWVCSAE